MNRIRNTITATIFSLLMALSGAGPLAAAEPQDDEKITMPKGPPASPGPGGISPPGGVPGRGDLPVPRPATPDGSGTTIIVPLPPGTGPSDTASPVEVPVVPVVPVQPDTTSPVEVPALPVLPQAPGGTLVLTPPLQQETTPQKEAIAPRSAPPRTGFPAVSEPDKQPSPMDFLPMPTVLAPATTQRDPKTQTPLTGEQAKPEPGSRMRMPPDAAKTGDLSFLEGCWYGTSDDSAKSLDDIMKSQHRERLCFDKDGNGKISSEWRNRAVKCAGPSQAGFDAQGRLIIDNSAKQGVCNKGSLKPSYFVCEGTGNATSCTVYSGRYGKQARPLNNYFMVRE